jgi:hypothetical protein
MVKGIVLGFWYSVGWFFGTNSLQNSLLHLLDSPLSLSLCKSRIPSLSCSSIHFNSPVNSTILLQSITTLLSTNSNIIVKHPYEAFFKFSIIHHQNSN